VKLAAAEAGQVVLGNGVHDDTAGIQAAVNLLAGTGVALWFPQGTYYTTSYVLLPSNLVIWGSASATMKLNLPGTFGSIEAAFVAYVIDDGSVPATTIASANTVGTNTVSAAASVPVGTWVQIGNALPAPQLLFRSGVYKVTAVSGGGPFTLTLDRPVVWTLVMNDIVQPVISAWNATYAPTVHDIPHDIFLCGNGMLISGTSQRFIEFDGSRHCVVQDFRLDSSLGSATAMWMSIDVGCFDCEARRITATGVPHGLALAGTLSLESAEACRYVHCTIEGATDSVGFLSFDANGSTWENCEAFGCSDGLFCNSGIPANLLGTQNCTVWGGRYNGNAANGIHVGNDGTIGSTDIAILGAQADSNANASVLLDTHARRVRIGDSALTNSVYGILLNASAPGVGPIGCSSDGCNFSGTAIGISGGDVDFVATNSYALNCADSLFYWVGSDKESGQLTLDGFNVQSGAAPGYAGLGRIDGGTVVVANGRASGGGGGAMLVLTASNCVAKVSGVRLDSTGVETGISVGAGCTLRMGDGVDLNGCSTPLTIAGGGFCNRKQTSAGSPGGTAVSWPDINSVDEVVLLPTAAVFTGWVSSRTPGVGFTITDAASGTYEYFIP